MSHLPAWAERMTPLKMQEAADALGLTKEELKVLCRNHPHFEWRGNKRVFYPEHIHELERGLFGSHVYFIRCQDRVKIGFTTNVRQRLREIKTMCPYPAELLATMPGSLADEQTLHEQWAGYRSHGEWFHYEYDLKDFIAEIAEK